MELHANHRPNASLKVQVDLNILSLLQINHPRKLQTLKLVTLAKIIVDFTPLLWLHNAHLLLGYFRCSLDPLSLAFDEIDFMKGIGLERREWRLVAMTDSCSTTTSYPMIFLGRRRL